MATVGNNTTVELYDGGVVLTLGNPRSMLSVMIYEATRNELVAQGFLTEDRKRGIVGSVNVVEMLDIFARAMAAFRHIHVDKTDDRYDVQVYADIFKVWKSNQLWPDKFLEFCATVDSDIAVGLRDALNQALPAKYRDTPEMAMSEEEIAEAEKEDPELEAVSQDAATN